MPCIGLHLKTAWASLGLPKKIIFGQAGEFTHVPVFLFLHHCYNTLLRKEYISRAFNSSLGISQHFKLGHYSSCRVAGLVLSDKHCLFWFGIWLILIAIFTSDVLGVGSCRGSVLNWSSRGFLILQASWARRLPREWRSQAVHQDLLIPLNLKTYGGNAGVLLKRYHWAQGDANTLSDILHSENLTVCQIKCETNLFCWIIW